MSNNTELDSLLCDLRVNLQCLPASRDALRLNTVLGGSGGDGSSATAGATSLHGSVVALLHRCCDRYLQLTSRLLASECQLPAPPPAPSTPPVPSSCDANIRLEEPGLAECLRTRCWHELHSGHWCHVPLLWRHLYSYCSLFLAVDHLYAAVLCQLSQCPDQMASLHEALRACDMGLIMGAPVLNGVLATLAEVCHRYLMLADRRYLSLDFQHALDTIHSYEKSRALATPTCDRFLQPAQLATPTLLSGCDSLRRPTTLATPTSAAHNDQSLEPTRFATPTSASHYDKSALEAALPGCPTVYTSTSASGVMGRQLATPVYCRPSLSVFCGQIVGRGPALLTGCTDHWPARRWTLAQLVARAGHRTVPVELGARYTDADWGQRLMPLGEFIANYVLDNGSGGGSSDSGRGSSGSEGGSGTGGGSRDSGGGSSGSGGGRGSGSGRGSRDSGGGSSDSGGGSGSGGGHGSGGGSSGSGGGRGSGSGGGSSDSGGGRGNGSGGESRGGGGGGDIDNGVGNCERGSGGGDKRGARVAYLAQYELFDQIPSLAADICVPEYCYVDTTSVVGPSPSRGRGVGGDDDGGAVSSLDKDRSLNATGEDSGQSRAGGGASDIGGEGGGDSGGGGSLDGGDGGDGGEGEVHVNIWLGPAGTVSPLHHDPKHNCLVQVFGYKLVRLYSPADSHLLYPHPDRLLCNTSRVDVQRPDRQLFPLFPAASWHELVLRPGDLLYLPPGWWHYVRSETPSCSISFWF